MPSDHTSSLCCSVQVFLTLLGSCAVVRPSQASDAEKDKQSNKWGSGIYGAFLKEVLLLSNVEHVTASIGSMQCAWACIKYRNAISY
jgi:hypothetical protein